MTKLNQLLAIEKGATQSAQRQLDAAYHLFQRPPVFAGLRRTYQPKDDEGETRPPESTRVQQTVGGLIAGLQAPMTRWLDVQWEKDIANLAATADVVVDGVTFLTGAPVTYLLWLEKRLHDFKTVLEKLPVLDASELWIRDEANDVFTTAGVQTQSTTKVPAAVVLYPATDKHPAQTEKYSKDVVVGIWTTVKLSGAVEPSRRQEALDRVEKILAAVRKAREGANMIDVPAVTKAGDRIFGYIFDPVS